MIKILLTGGSGFIGSNICKSLSKNHTIYSPPSKIVDFSNFNQVRDLFSSYQFDIIIHSAFIGGRRTKEDSLSDFVKNTLMVDNLLKFNKFYKLLINFDSGASFDRRYSINNKKEYDRLEKTYIPDDFYGRAKFMNNLELMKYKNIINLRIFNCFSEFGMNNSFIPTVINRCLQDKPVTIWKDFRFDTFYIQDLIKAIEHFIQNPPESYFEMNLCYKKKYLLSELAKKIKLLIKSKSDIIIEEKSKNHYTGNGDRLEGLGLKLVGLTQGLKNCIEYYKNGQKTN